MAQERNPELVAVLEPEFLTKREFGRSLILYTTLSSNQTITNPSSWTNLQSSFSITMPFRGRFFMIGELFFALGITGSSNFQLRLLIDGVVQSIQYYYPWGRAAGKKDLTIKLGQTSGDAELSAGSHTGQIQVIQGAHAGLSLDFNSSGQGEGVREIIGFGYRA